MGNAAAEAQRTASASAASTRSPDPAADLLRARPGGRNTAAQRDVLVCMVLAALAAMGGCRSTADDVCDEFVCIPRFREQNIEFDTGARSDCEWLANRDRVRQRCIESYDRIFARLPVRARADIQRCLDCYYEVDFTATCSSLISAEQGGTCERQCTSAAVEFLGEVYAEIPDRFECTPAG